MRAELGFVQLLIHAALSQQLVMRAALGDDAIGQGEDLVRRHDGGKPVGDDDAGSSLHEHFQRVLNGAFRDGVQRRGGLVQKQDGRILEDDARDGDALLLAAGQLEAAVAHLRVVAIGLGDNEVVDGSRLARGHDLLIRRIFLGIAQVFADGAVEQVGVLRHVADLAAQVGEIKLLHIQRRRLAFESGRAVCDLARKGIRTRDIVTPAAIRNAIRVVLTTSGSTNAVLHLSALAHEAELDLDVMAEFETLYPTTPQIARVNPAAKWDMEDFYQAGGIPRVMDRLGRLLDRSVLTCTGKTLDENLRGYRYEYPENPAIIRTLDDPFGEKGGIAVLRGNLAPRTGVTKPGAYDPSLYHFVGRARVFDGEEAADAAILAGEVKPGDVLVIRYEGPRGGPGMREMYKAMKLLYGMGLGSSTAVITDGRFSGTNNGCFVGHISPEAAEGGPIALVEDGDEICIDVNEGSLELLVSKEDLERRRRNWKPAKRPEVPRGYLRLYAAAASSADRGAVLELGNLLP